LNDRSILVGSGHLAGRIKSLIVANGAEVLWLAHDDARATAGGETAFQATVRMFRETDLTGVSSAYLVDDRDEINLEFLLALLSADPSLPIVVSLFNENIAPHLQAANPNVRVLNPAKIAAPAFVAALDAPLSHRLRYVPARIDNDKVKRTVDPLIAKLTAGFVTMLLAATWFFHSAQQLSWVDATYFVAVTVATVGYGDINLLNAGTGTKLVGIGLIIGSTFFIWMIFSLTVDRIIKRRVQLALGRRKYAHRGHVIVCGLGRLGYFIAEGCWRAANACWSSNETKIRRRSSTSDRLAPTSMSVMRDFRVYCRKWEWRTPRRSTPSSTTTSRISRSGSMHAPLSRTFGLCCASSTTRCQFTCGSSSTSSSRSA
jgi:hypothetical protein